MKNKIERKYSGLESHFLRLEKQNLIELISGKMYKHDFERQIMAIPGEMTAKITRKDDLPQLVETVFQRVGVEVYKFTGAVFSDPETVDALYRLYIVNGILAKRELR